jgi:hypothetical protein
MKKVIAIIGGVLVIGLVLVVALNWSLIRQIATFSPIILPNFGSTPTDDAEARLQDVEHLAKLLDYDRSFDETERTQFEQLVTGSVQEAETMSLAQLYLLASKATALADNGHTGVEPLPVQREFNAVGVRYFHFSDGWYVVRALNEYEQLIGGRVLDIDGQPIDSVMTELASYFGGTEGWRRLQAGMLLESPEILHAAGLSDSPDGYTLAVQDQQGATQQVELTARRPQSAENIPLRGAWNNLEAKALPDEGDDWVHSLQVESDDLLPLYLQDTDQRYFWKPLQNGGYLRLQTMFNTQQQTMSAFFEENLQPIPEGSLRYLVVDLRSNSGGDFTNLVEIAKKLPGKLADDGHLYVVVGPKTFSAAVDGTALLKYYGGEKSSIIGSPMGGREQYWGEYGMPFLLPNSGFQILYATGYHDLANGCEEHPYCFTQVLEHGVAAGSLTPDHIIEPEYADYAAGRDVVMEWVYQQELS